MDVRYKFQRLHAALTRLGFNSWHNMTEDEVLSGSPAVYSDFFRFILMSFPSVTAALLRKHSWLVIEGNDQALAHSVVRLLSEEYRCSLPLTIFQFPKRQFASQKMTLCLSLISSLSGDAKKLLRQRNPNETRAPLLPHNPNAERPLALVDKPATVPESASSVQLVSERRQHINSAPRR